MLNEALLPKYMYFFITYYSWRSSKLNGNIWFQLLQPHQIHGSLMILHLNIFIHKYQG